jgi:hypothetical protein
MKNGTISSNTANKDGGGGVFVNENAVFTMDDGIISGNTARYGGGVRVGSSSINATFTMEGGTISGNTAANSNGGGVHVGDNATFTMKNGTISGNTANNDGGGGVYIGDNATFTMSGTAVINGNTAREGGGVKMNDDSTFTMNDNATVKGNHATTTGSVSGEHGIGNAEGGGVVVCGIFIMNDTTMVAGNTAKCNTNQAEGGGVEMDGGDFTLSGGTVYGDSSHEADPSLANTVTSVSGYTRGAAVYGRNGTVNNIPLTENDGTATSDTVHMP